MYVYMDLVVLLNFLVDLLLLLGTNRLSGFPPGWKRVIPAAALGGLYGGGCMIPGFSFLGKTLWRVVFLGLMAVTAFGCDRFAWKRCGIFVLLSMALGGIASNMGNGDFLGLLVSAVLVWLLCRIGFGNSMPGRTYVPVEIRNGDRLIRLVAMCDTGNTLRDPISGEQVLVIDAEAAQTLTGLTPAQLENPMGTLGKLPGLRLIPYQTIESKGRFLLSKRFSDVKIGKWSGPAVVAFAPQAIGRGEGCRALTGGAMG